jgi:hypothetical protein
MCWAISGWRVHDVIISTQKNAYVKSWRTKRRNYNLRQLIRTQTPLTPSFIHVLWCTEDPRKSPASASRSRPSSSRDTHSRATTVPLVNLTQFRKRRRRRRLLNTTFIYSYNMSQRCTKVPIGLWYRRWWPHIPIDPTVACLWPNHPPDTTHHCKKLLLLGKNQYICKRLERSVWQRWLKMWTTNPRINPTESISTK